MWLVNIAIANALLNRDVQKRQRYICWYEKRSLETLLLATSDKISWHANESDISTAPFPLLRQPLSKGRSTSTNPQIESFRPVDYV